MTGTGSSTSRRAFLGGMSVLAGCALAGCSKPQAADVAGTRWPGHPRLIATPRTTTAARTALVADARGRAWREDFLRRAERLLSEPVAPREFEPKRPVLLPTSRRVLERIQNLGIARALTGDERFAERGVRELIAACAFPDWNPTHFLDVAEMGHAVGIGYDWFFDRLDSGQRRLVRDALADKALYPGLREFTAGRFWTTATHNWNIVCNGGLTVAALAVADELPDLAERVLARTLESARLGFSSFAPDGGWNEGPGYWEYATAYAAVMLAALETAGVADEALGNSPGFAATGAFAAHATAPSGRLFNYADGGERMRRAPQHLWLARRFGRLSDAWPEFARADAPAALDLLWYMPPPPPPERLDAVFQGVEVATFRGSWSDPGAIWLAIKGGDNGANHGNLDLGTFVLESEGERFAIDLGGDDYALAGYFGPQRFTYYRTMSVGQNVLVRGDANQARSAKAAIAAFRSSPDFAAAVVDLSQAYPGMRHQRGAALIDRRHAAVVDEFENAEPAAFVWQMHTRADVAIDGAAAILTQGRARLHARILAPGSAGFEVADATAPPPQNANAGVRKLVVRLPPRAGRRRLVILLSPDPHPLETVGAAALQSLAEWSSA